MGLKKKTKLILSTLMISFMIISVFENIGAVTVKAASEDVVLYYEMAEQGDMVMDSQNDYDGTLVGTTSWVDGIGGKAIQLAGGEDYIQVPNAAFTQSDNVTISVWVKPDKIENWTTLFVAGSGTDNYAIMAAKGTPNNNAVGLTMAIRVDGGEEYRVAADEGVTLNVNEWSLVTYTQEGTKATLYLNGEQVAQTDEMKGTIKGVIDASDNADVRIGDNHIFGDPSLKGAVTELKISKIAVSENEMKEEVMAKSDSDVIKVQQGANYVQRYVDYILNDEYELLTGDKMDEYLGEELNCNIEWRLIEGKAVIQDGKLMKTEDSLERQPVKLKVIVSKGETSKEVILENITLIDQYVGYILSFFGGEDGQQKLHLGYSYDGINWKKLNDGNTVLNTTLGNGNVRDPYIMRKKDGSFAVIATQGWDTSQIYLWDSEDLINYSNERLKQVTYSGEVGLTGARAWAPEASYDPITDQYIIYWSDPYASDNKGKTYANTSSDLNEFSKPYVLFDAGYQIIDANIIKWRGTYYMVFKDERGNNSDGGGGKHILMAKSDSLQAGTFTQYTDAITEAPVEGPFMFKVNGENKWYHYYDYFNEHKFGVSVTTDLDSGEWEFLGKSTTMPTDTVQHGGAIAVTQKELNRIVDALDMSENFLSIEGEYGEVEGGTIEENTNMSNNHYVGFLGGKANGTSTIRVNAIKEGKHTLKVYYATANERQLGVKVNNIDYAIQCPATGGWTTLCETPQSIEVELQTGENIIQLGGVDGGDAPNMDRIEIELNASESQAMMQHMVDSLPSGQDITLEDKIKFDAVKTTYDLLDNKLSIENVDVLSDYSNQIEKCQEAKEQLDETVKLADEVYEYGQGDYTEESWNAFVSAYQAATNAADNLTVDELNNLQKALEEAQENLEIVADNAPEISCSHNNKKTIGEKEASCKEEGYTGDVYCEDCDEKLEEGTVIEKLMTHSWDEGTVTIEATETTDGEKTYYCMVCGEDKKEVIPATGTESENAGEAENGSGSENEGGTETGSGSENEGGTETGSGSENEGGIETGNGDKTDEESSTEDETTNNKVNQVVKVEKIRITGISKKIAAGKKIQLSAKVSPANATNTSVIWKSSNRKYATVDKNGVVKLKKAGKNKKVTITATAVDGSGVKKKYKITIMPKAVKKITIKADKKVVKAGKKVRLKAIISPNVASKKVNKKVKWSSSNKKYAIVTSKGVVKTKKAGKGKKVKITAKATDGSNKKKTIIITIK